MNIESYGLEFVPETERKSNWLDLLVIWGGVSFCLPSFIIGALLVPAFSWNEAIWINFLGNLIVGILIVLGGYFGTTTGYPAVMMGRYVFGSLIGHWLPTVALLFSTVGWYAVMTAMTGEILNTMLKASTGFSNLPLITITIGIINSLTAVFGFQKIKWFSRFAFPFLSVFCIIIAYRIMSVGSLTTALNYEPTGLLTFGQGIDFMIGGFLSGAFAASDFSRYIKNHYHNWCGTLMGTFFISFLLGLLGMLSMAVTGSASPLGIVQGMGIPILFFVLLANWTTNDNLLYSSGLALTNALPCFSRWKNTIFCGIAGTTLAVMGITNHLESWLVLISYIFSPLLGVVLTELFVIKNQVKNASINMNAVIAVIGGILLVKITPAYCVTSIVGIIGSSIIYLLLNFCKRRVTNS